MKKLLLIALVAGGLMFTGAPRSDAGVSVRIGFGFPVAYPYPYPYPYAYPYPYGFYTAQPFTRDHHFTGTMDIAFLSRGILMFTMFIIDNELNAVSTKSLSWLDIHVEPA